MPDGSWDLLDKPNDIRLKELADALKGDEPIARDVLQKQELKRPASMSTAEWVQRAADLRKFIRPEEVVARHKSHVEAKWDRNQQEIMRRLDPVYRSQLRFNDYRQAEMILNKGASLNKLAANAAVLADLKKAKKESDKGNYAAKTDILRKLLKEFPDEFKTDSENAHVVGLTHKPTNFRIHMPKKALPTKIKEEKQSTGAPKKALPTKAKDKKKMHT